MRHRCLLFAAALLVPACGGSGGSDATTSGTLTPAKRLSSTGKLSVVSPKAGEVLSRESAPIKLELTGAEILLQSSSELRPDRGHMHLDLDDRTITLLAGLEVDLVKIIGKPLEPGPHLLKAEFAGGDHLPFNPRVIATVSFTVE